MLELNKVAAVEIAKFVHEEELAFRIRNWRNKRFGLWLATELGLSEEALGYADAIVALGISNADDEGLIRRVQADLAQRGVHIPDAVLRSELERQTVFDAAWQ
jgi:hypothetical protein